MKFTAAVLLAVLVGVHSLSYDFSSVDKISQDFIANQTFPGTVMSVFSTSEQFHSQIFGNYTYPGDDYNLPVRDDTVWDMASCTKVIACTSATMKLYEWGLIKLDDKLIKYVPQANNHGKDQITIRNLLLHNAGLAADYPFGPVPNISRSDLVNWFYNMSLSYQIGSKMIYSDISMVFMQMIIENIVGMDLNEFTHKYVFGPMNMTLSLFKPDSSYKERNQCAPTEIYNNVTFLFLSGFSGFSGFCFSWTHASGSRCCYLLPTNWEMLLRSFLECRIFTTTCVASTSCAAQGFPLNALLKCTFP